MPCDCWHSRLLLKFLSTFFVWYIYCFVAHRRCQN
uniref:Uncharacterized protein n=1 Tax=Arundo donax TaxID=35708 RepID=A0A0A8XS47_ARUDO